MCGLHGTMHRLPLRREIVLQLHFEKTTRLSLNKELEGGKSQGKISVGRQIS